MLYVTLGEPVKEKMCDYQSIAFVLFRKLAYGRYAELPESEFCREALQKER